jgi:UrcA family protein
MNTRASVLNVTVLTCIAAAAACALLSAPIEAEQPAVTVKINVSTAGLDPRQPAGARELYVRLQAAARVVCAHGDRVDLLPVADFAGCYEQAVADAVRSARLPQLTLAYLASHTLQDAATRGIEVPVMVAAK